MYMDLGRENIVCECFSSEHQFNFIYDRRREWEECYLDVHLNPGRRGFWRRLWHGIRYAFGHRSKYGAFDEVVIDIESAERIRNVMDEFLKGQQNK